MNANKPSPRILFLTLPLLAVLLVGTVPVPSTASATTVAPAASAVNFMPPAPAQPLGKSWAEWNAAWWQWALAQATPVSAVLDAPGASCAEGQSPNGPIWFLAGKLYGGEADRTCTVPLGRHIYIPVANAFGAEPVGTDPSILEADKAAAIAAIDNLCGMSLEVDGQPVGNLQAYRAPTGWFTSELPVDNYWSAPAGEYTTFADGYGVILAPLSPGAHTVHIYACFADQWPGVMDVTYALTISQ